MFLTLVLFGAIFSSIVWVIYALRFIDLSLGGISFFDAGIVNVLLYALFVCLPILIIWAIFGFISQYVYNRLVNRQIFKIFSQMKKNQEYSDLLARIMLETEQNIKNYFVLGRFDLIIADMNELLSEFLYRARLASAEQIEHIWTKIQNGGKWSFGKVVIENYNQQATFQQRIFNEAQNDALLSGTIMEFCARYQTLLGLLEKHDKERVLLGIIETGVLGKVFSILAPIADQLRKTREAFAPAENTVTAIKAKSERIIVEEKAPDYAQPDKERVTASNILGEKVNKIIGKIIPQRKSEAKPAPAPKDAFSLALERSFGNNVENKEEPVFDRDGQKTQDQPQSTKLQEDTVSTTIAVDAPVLDTQKTLDTLKKEWQELEQNKPSQPMSQNNDEDQAFPFGGWTDVENYQK